MSCVHRTKDGVCRKCSAGKYVAYCPDGPCQEEIVTNGDRIRAMTDEELAEWMHNGISSDVCDYCEYNKGYCDGSPCRGKSEAEIITDWLKQPVEEKGHE